MTQQEARAELKQIRTYFNRISERKQRLAELRSSMGSIKISKYGNQPATGATPGDKYKLESVIDRVMKLEDKISDDLVAMMEAQQRIIEKIERLPDPYATVLSKRYIHLDRFEKIAVDMNYSFRSVKVYCTVGIKKYAEL